MRRLLLFVAQGVTMKVTAISLAGASSLLKTPGC